MSLLMAFFVLLYAMSSIDVPKYKAVVESLTEALGNGSELTPEQEQFFQ
jgi:chemotaxis protein MotB